jgi:hypothetical protein
MAAQQPDIKRTDLQQHDLSIPDHAVHAVRNGGGNAAELAT